MIEDAFAYLYARYVVECARNGNSPLAPDELRELIEALRDDERRKYLPAPPTQLRGRKKVTLR